jgi:hypothetical protein
MAEVDKVVAVQKVISVPEGAPILGVNRLYIHRNKDYTAY